MDRLPPYDKIGVNPPPLFENADPTTGNIGSIVNGLIFNQLQGEGLSLIKLAGGTPSTTDLTQWAQAASRGGIWAGSLTGTGDLAVATLGAVLPALLQGMRIGAVASASNTTTAPKLRVTNLNTLGGYTDFPILLEDGSAPAIGAIKAGRRYRYEADGAGNVLITGGGIGAGASTPVPGRFRTLAVYKIDAPTSGISIDLNALGASIRDFRLTFRIRGVCDYISTRYSLDGGATFKMGSSDYTTSTWTNFNGTAAASFNLVRLTNNVADADGFAMGTVNLTRGSSTSKAQIFAIGGTEYGAGYTGYANIEVSKLNIVGAITNLLLFPESGQIPGDSLIVLEGLDL